MYLKKKNFLVVNNFEILNSPCMQLTTRTYAAAVSVASQVVEQSTMDTNRQTNAVLNTVAGYLMDLSTFVKDSEVIINASVRLSLSHPQ